MYICMYILDRSKLTTKMNDYRANACSHAELLGPQKAVLKKTKPILRPVRWAGVYQARVLCCSETTLPCLMLFLKNPDYILDAEVNGKLLRFFIS